MYKVVIKVVMLHKVG